MIPPEQLRQQLGPLLSGESWRRRVALWGGGVVVALAAILFARLCDLAFRQFHLFIQHSVWWALLLTPSLFALLAWLTSGKLKPTRGSGIPQVIAALDRPDETFRHNNLSLLMSLGKLSLTALALLGGASVGREGPTVHIGASLMYLFGRWFRFRDAYEHTHFLLAGGAAGIAAAFNTPLAGVVFAIEELSGRFEHRFSGTLLTAVIVAGVVSLGLLGSYTYFGKVNATLPLGKAWVTIALCGLAGGTLGGGFARAVLACMSGHPLWLGQLKQRHPVLLAAGCGLMLVLLGVIFGPGVFGTGYEHAHGFMQGVPIAGHEFGLVKLSANFISYVAGIPGGLFSPALAVGAGIGYNISAWLPSVDPHAVILLGMCGYLAGVTQTPLTSAVISLELTDTNELLLPVLATVLIARGVSSLICEVPIYRGLAEQLMPKLS